MEWDTGERERVKTFIRVPNEVMANLKPVWKIIIPNMRQRESVTFRRQQNPITRKRWPDLEPTYKERKEKMYPGKRILEATGLLRRAASRKGAPGQVVVMKRNGMVFGVELGVIYPLVHQTTGRSRKDGTPIKRVWFGFTAKELALMVKFAIDEVFKKKFKRVKGARVRA